MLKLSSYFREPYSVPFPEVIISAPDIPRTRSGKITELAVRNVIEGRAIKNAEALANPESLKFFENLIDLEK